MYNYKANMMERLMDGVNQIALLLFATLTTLPFLYILAASFASPAEVLASRFILFPKTFSLDAYLYIFSTNTIIRSLLVSIYVTALGTTVNLLFTVLLAYPLSRRDLQGRSMFMFLIVFTILFSGGMIPTFLVVKATGLLNTYWALILPIAISPFNLIIVKNFFQNLPAGIEEAAKVDGCTDLGILFRIVLPLSMPVLATFGLFYAVGHWNSYFSAVLYISDANKWPLQVWLRQIIILAQGGIGDSEMFSEEFVPPSQTVKMAIVVISTVPILMVYPFLQKHFAKGVLLGSVKG